MAYRYVVAPEDWSYHRFPRPSSDVEEIDLQWVAAVGSEIVGQAQMSGDHTNIGLPLHWAHRFVSSQRTGGDWPSTVNARTGQVIDPLGTIGPAEFLSELADLQSTSEFDLTISEARGAGLAHE